MATLKCSYCGFGIHYHDEPDGTQYFLYSLEAWEDIRKNNIPIVCYDSADSGRMRYVWKCCKCGTLALFGNDDISVEKIFVPDTNIKDINKTNAEYYIVFDDVNMEKIYDSNVKVSNLFTIFPRDCCKYCVITNKELFVFDNPNMKIPIKSYHNKPANLSEEK